VPVLRNINPLGEVDLPLIGRSLAAGEEFEVSDEHAAILLEQEQNYELAGEPAPVVSAPAEESTE